MNFKNKSFVVISATAVISVVIAAAVFSSLARNYPPPPAAYEIAPTDLTKTVSLIGKVKAAQDIDLAFQISGRVAAASVQVGERVKKGQILVSLDASDAEAGLRQAKAGLDSAQIALEKMKRPPEALDLLTARNAVAQAEDAQDKASDDLAKAADAAQASVASGVSVMQTSVSSLKEILHSTDFNPGQDNLDYYADTARVYSPLADTYRSSAENAYQAAKIANERLAVDYQNADADSVSRKAILAESYATIQKVSDAIKSAGQLLDLYSGKLTEKQIAVPAAEIAARARLSSLQAQSDAAFSALGNAERAVKSSEDAVSASARSLAQAKESLAKLESGAEDIDIRAQEARVEQARAAFDAARSAFNKTRLSAPFDGVISKKSIEPGEMAAVGVSAVSMVSSDAYEIDGAVSEADIAAVAVGESAEVTLDTFGSERFSAAVVSVDPVPAVQNGIGSYGLKLHFDKQDDRIKPGMTANVEIVVAKKTGIIAVPQSAVITRGSDKFVIIFDAFGKKAEKKVVAGASGSDGKVEITSGLELGDKIAVFGAN